MEKLEPLCTVWNLNVAIATENSMRIFQKIKTELPYDSAIPLAYIHPQKLKLGSQWGICTLMLDAITDSIDMGLGGLRKLVMDREARLLRFLWLQRVGHDWATKLNRPVHGSIICKKICVQILMLKFNNYAFFFLYSYFLAIFMFMSPWSLEPCSFCELFLSCQGHIKSPPWTPSCTSLAHLSWQHLPLAT